MFLKGLFNVVGEEEELEREEQDVQPIAGVNLAVAVTDQSSSINKYSADSWLEVEENTVRVEGVGEDADVKMQNIITVYGVGEEEDPLKISECEMAEMKLPVAKDIDIPAEYDKEEECRGEFILPDIQDGASNDYAKEDDEEYVRASPPTLDDVTLQGNNQGMIISQPEAIEDSGEPTDEEEEEQEQEMKPRIGTTDVLILDPGFVKITRGIQMKKKAQQRKIQNKSGMRPTDWWSSKRRRRKRQKTDNFKQTDYFMQTQQSKHFKQKQTEHFEETKIKLFSGQTQIIEPTEPAKQPESIQQVKVVSSSLRKTTGYVCSYCRKCLTTRHGLIAHEKIHRGDLNYKCSFCSQWFVTTQHRYYHQKTVHQYKKRGSGRASASGNFLSNLPEVSTTKNDGRGKRKFPLSYNSNNNIKSGKKKAIPEVTPDGPFPQEVKDILKIDAMNVVRHQVYIKPCTVKMVRHSSFNVSSNKTLPKKKGRPRISSRNSSSCKNVGVIKKKFEDVTMAYKSQQMVASSTALKKPIVHNHRFMTKTGTNRRYAKHYPCSHCGKILSSYNSRWRHETIHSGISKYKCDLCTKAFTTPNALYHHRKTFHKNWKPNKIIQSSEVNERPQQIQHNDEFKLKSCSVHLERQSALQLWEQTWDAKSMSRQKALRCPFCQCDCARKSVLRNHITRMHMKSARLHQCPQCDKTFGLAWEMKRHILGVHTKGAQYCSVRGCTTRSQPRNETEMKIHLLKAHNLKKDPRQYKCDECGKRYLTGACLATHMNVVHQKYLKSPKMGGQIENSPAVIHEQKEAKVEVRKDRSFDRGSGSPSPAHKCPHCPGKFNTQKRLKLHVIVDHGNIVPTTSSQSQLPMTPTGPVPAALLPVVARKSLPPPLPHAPPKQQRGPISSQRKVTPFAYVKSKRTNYRGHISRESLNCSSNRRPKRPLICLFCGLKCKQYAHLELHMCRHTAERAYQCSHCPVSYAYPYILRQHEKMYHSQTDNIINNGSRINMEKSNCPERKVTSPPTPSLEVTNNKTLEVVARKSLPPPLPNSLQNVKLSPSSLKTEEKAAQLAPCTSRNKVNKKDVEEGRVQRKKCKLQPKRNPRRSMSCDICQTVISNRYNLKRHKALIHKVGEIGPSDGKVMSEPVQCGICQKVISQKFNLRRHMMLVHKENTGLSENETTKVEHSRINHKDLAMKHSKDSRKTGAVIPGESQKGQIAEKELISIKCTLCLLEFKSKAALNLHTKKRHHKPQTDHTCQSCQATFSTETELRQHSCPFNMDAVVLEEEEEERSLQLWERIAADFEQEQENALSYSEENASEDNTRNSGALAMATLLNDSDRAFLDMINHMPLD